MADSERHDPKNAPRCQFESWVDISSEAENPHFFDHLKFPNDMPFQKVKQRMGGCPKSSLIGKLGNLQYILEPNVQTQTIYWFFKLRRRAV
jgi:hypothetical protein